MNSIKITSIPLKKSSIQRVDSRSIVIKSSSSAFVVKSENHDEKVLINCNDLSNLNEIDVGSILQSLIFRYNSSKIYTRCGRTLFAINPMKIINNLYCNDTMNQYKNSSSLPDTIPHIYQIAEETFQSENNLTSIIVTGESGSGKTENVRHLINYLSSRNGTTNEKAIEKRLVESNLLLEALGNAKTQMNKNSSRFVKLLKISFDNKASISTANIEAILLEKTRVHSSDLSEFHIFHQFLSQNKMKLSKYFGNCLDYIEIKKEFKNLSFSSTYNSLKLANLDDSEITGFCQVIAAILLLKLFKFKCTEDSNIPFPILDKNNDIDEALYQIEELLGIDESDIISAITTRQLKPGSRRRSVFVVRFSPNECLNRLKSFLEFLYCRTFNFILNRINKSFSDMRNNVDKISKSIQILDIFGFELNNENSLEQLCINFANEKLQEHYLKVCVIDKEKRFLLEGITFEKTSLFRNLENKTSLDISNFVFSALNDPVVMKNDFAKSTIIESLRNSCKNVRSICVKPSASGYFVIKHYAKDVEYTVNGMIEKNSVADHNVWLNLIEESENQFLRNIFDCSNEKKVVSNSKKHTLLNEHKICVENLIKILENTDERFVRCFKPCNVAAEELELGIDIDKSYLYNQLCNSGIVQEVQIAQLDYPYFYEYQQFLDMQIFHSESYKINKESIREFVIKSLKVYNFIEPKNIRYGKTGIFLDDISGKFLKNLRNLSLNSSARKIQRAWNSYRFKKKLEFMKEKRSAKIIENFFRKIIEKKKTACKRQILSNVSRDNIQSNVNNSIEKSIIPNYLPTITNCLYMKMIEKKNCISLMNLNRMKVNMHYGTYKLNKHNNNCDTSNEDVD